MNPDFRFGNPAWNTHSNCPNLLKIFPWLLREAAAAGILNSRHWFVFLIFLVQDIISVVRRSINCKGIFLKELANERRTYKLKKKMLKRFCKDWRQIFKGLARWILVSLSRVEWVIAALEFIFWGYILGSGMNFVKERLRCRLGNCVLFLFKINIFKLF